MFYALSKLLDVALSPLCWIMLLLATALLRRSVRRIRIQLGVGVGLLYLCSLPTCAGMLWAAGEASAVSTERPELVYDAVVVLGGLADASLSQQRGEPVLFDAVERVVRAHDLLRRGRARYAILSAGPERRPTEASVLATLLERWGIARDRLLLEERSHNTRDNAVESVRIARAHGFTRLLVVTSALHMPRALGCFRAAGMEVDAAPTDWHSAPGQRFAGFSLRPRGEALMQVDYVVRELAGRVVYRAVGYAR